MQGQSVMPVVMMLLLAGCLGTIEETGPGPQEGPESAPAQEDPPVETEEENTTEPEAPEPEPGPPLGGPRETIVWSDIYTCAGFPGLGCARHERTFEVHKLYGAITLSVTMESPGSTQTNGFYVSLERPNGERAGFESFPFGIQQGGETVSIPIDDPVVLSHFGTWTVSLWTVDIAATAVMYKAGVSFSAHPAYVPSGTGESLQIPSTITFNATQYAGGYPAVEWDRIEDFLPEGFEPRGYPDEMLLNDRRGLPEGTLAATGLLILEYSDAQIDDQSLPAGKLAMAWAKAEPPSDYDDGFAAGIELIGMMWIGVVATDPDLTQALRAWEIPASTGKVGLSYESLGPYLHLNAIATGGDMDMQVEAHLQNLESAGGGVSSYRHWSARGDTLAQVMLWTLSSHQGYPGAMKFSGTFGAIGDIETSGYGGLLWFGGTAEPAGVPGLWQYELGEWG